VIYMSIKHALMASFAFHKLFFAQKKIFKDILNSEICYRYDLLVIGHRVVQFREKSRS